MYCKCTEKTSTETNYELPRSTTKYVLRGGELPGEATMPMEVCHCLVVLNVPGGVAARCQG